MQADATLAALLDEKEKARERLFHNVFWPKWT